MISFISNKNQKLVKAILNGVTGVSFSTVQKLLRAKDVKVNGVRVKEDVTVNMGDKIDVYLKEESLLKVYLEIYSDENVLVVFKKSGYTSENLFEMLKKGYKELYFIHRLDRNTSGVMIFAKNKISETELLNGFKKRTFVKKYLATVFGEPKIKKATLRAYLFKDSKQGKVYISNQKKKGYLEIVTAYEVISSKNGNATLEVELITGRTHQIRAHLAYIGHFILGDGKYGDDSINKKLGLKRQMLTSYYLKTVFDKDSPLFYLNGREFIFREE